MSVARDNQHVRPNSQHRLSATSTPSSNLPIRHQASRHHSHSVSLGTLNQTHRVTRRKSMTSTGANTAAIAAALSGAGPPMPQLNRQSMTLKGNHASRPLSGSGEALRNETAHLDRAGHDSALIDDDELMQDGDDALDSIPLIRVEKGSSKARARRASEGSHLSKSEGKRASGELRCEKCGKGYKHSSCLTKHLWEHTPEWSYTSKLLISKHQQVQLLEAASVLVGMNQESSVPEDNAKTTESDHSSASPDISAPSELYDDDISSAETTPPPTSEPVYAQDSFSAIQDKRHSGTSSAFSRSYQSAPSSSYAAGSMPSSSYGQQYPYQRRPSTSGTLSASQQAVDEEEAGLAAAVQSLCSFGTPRTGPVHLPPGVPPVPPLPAQYAAQNTKRLSANTVMTPTPHDFGLPPTATQRISNERGSSKNRGSRSTYHGEDDELDHFSMHQTRNNDDDDIGIFGRMDE
ncbi:MAG: hypothetical protein LQ350_001344 [Teloschistes chrysophthalmus]|nr:MAG: hypothetical protein LQ350_001344 [Niorma chrysophthalma]